MGMYLLEGALLWLQGKGQQKHLFWLATEVISTLQGWEEEEVWSRMGWEEEEVWSRRRKR